MTWTKNLIATAAALAVLVGAPLQAEARFGKRSSDDKSSSSSSKKGSSKSSSSSSSKHKAVPVSAPSSSAPSYSSHHEAHPVRPSYSGHRHNTHYRAPRYARYHHTHYHYGWGFGYYPYFAAATPPPAPAAEAPVAAVKTGPSLTFGVDAHGHGLGATVGAGMAIEGKRWGFNGQLSNALYLAEENVGFDPEGTLIIDLHLTYALLSGTHGRLRLEGGVNGVVSPELSVLGPDAGASLALALIGPVGVEAAAHVTPVPHRRYDYNVGLTLTLGHVGLRAGWKEMWLDDNGLLEPGVHHQDTFRGPYFGVGFVF